MKIAVLSGKGGTGKTFVSVNLAASCKEAVYVDCDVEEPNGHLFFKPKNVIEKPVFVKIPVIDQDKCNGCRKCVEFCEFNALAYINEKLLFFDKICHSCGGCALFCPQKAIHEVEKPIGKIEKGISENVSVLSGTLETGGVSGVPIIEKLLDDIKLTTDCSDGTKSNINCIIDCPPGSACVVMESIKDADYCVLVGEPTKFGVHNFEMVYQLVTLFNKPFGAILNKCIEGENPSEVFCIENNIPILEKIPFSDELGKINSNGLIAVREKNKYKELFTSIFKKISKEVQN